MRIALLVDIRSEFLIPDMNARVPMLARCISRGDPLALASPRFDDFLLDDFGMRPDDAPLAAIGLAGEGDEPGPDYWLRADPVSLQPTLHRIAGRRLQAGELDWNDARTLAGVLDEHLRPEGCELRVKDPLRWYVRSPHQRMSTRPLSDSLVPLDEALMPTGPDAPRWQRIMTEAQMLFHATDLNTAREAAGLPLVNGIWCWGGGEIDAPPNRRYTDVFSDNVLALGLARLSAAGAVPLTADSAVALSQVRSLASGEVLIAVSDRQLLKLDAFESNWLAPLVTLVEDGTAERLDMRLLMGTRAIGRRITRKSLRRWWRRSRPVVPHA